MGNQGAKLPGINWMPSFRLLPILPCLLVAAAVMTASIVYGLSDPGYGGDSQRYVDVGKNILFNNCVSTSDPILMGCIPHWGGNQFPGYPAIIAFAGFVSNLEVTSSLEAFAGPVIVVQAIILGLVIFRLCVAVASYLNSTWAAVAVGLAAGFSPLHFAWARWILTESLSTTMTVWLLAEIILCLRYGKLRILPIALPLAVNFFIRYDSITLCAAIVILAFYLHDPWTAVRRGILIAVLMLLPIAVWSGRNMAAGLSVYPMADYGVGHMRGAGYYDWVATWETNLYSGAAAAFPFANRRYSKINVDEISFADRQEEIEVRYLLRTLSQRDGEVLPQWIDQRFSEIADAKRGKYPFQIWLRVPLLRAYNIWIATGYSYGWRIELGDQVRSRILAKAWRSAIIELLAEPVKIAGKLVLAIYHIALLGIFILAAIIRQRPGAAWHAPYYCVATYALVRTIFLVQIGQADPRLTIEPYALIACVMVMALFRQPPDFRPAGLPGRKSH